jgi:hypothetical protein
MSDVALVARYFDRDEALIARGVLDAAGLYCHLTEFHSLTVWPHYSVALGGHRLLVRGDDLASACEVLRAARSAPITEGEALEKRSSSTLLTLYFGLPIPLRAYKWRAAAPR